jgi:hypothetical protein
MNYIFTLTSLFLLAIVILVSALTIYRFITLIPEDNPSAGKKFWIAFGNSIHSVLLNNNGWFVVFLTMAILSIGIAFYAQFGRPPLVDQAIIVQEQAANKNTAIQKTFHALLDWDVRKDTIKEQALVAADFKEYSLQFPDAMYAWPWWSCSLFMFVVTILSIPLVLADEGKEVWQHIREHHTNGPQGDGAMHENPVARFFDSIFHHKQTSPPPTRPLATTGTQQPPPPESHAPQFSQVLIMDFLAGLLSKILTELFSAATE